MLREFGSEGRKGAFTCQSKSQKNMSARFCLKTEREKTLHGPNISATLLSKCFLPQSLLSMNVYE